MMKIGKIIEVILIVISILLVLWVGLSWLEVIFKNMEPNPNYSVLNFFNYMTGGM